MKTNDLIIQHVECSSHPDHYLLFTLSGVMPVQKSHAGSGFLQFSAFFYNLLQRFLFEGFCGFNSTCFKVVDVFRI